MRPVSASSVARRSPIAAATARKITNGHSPMRISVSPKVASSAATTTWQFATKPSSPRQRGTVYRGNQRLRQPEPGREQLLVHASR